MGQNGYISFKVDVTGFPERRAAGTPCCCGPETPGVHGTCPNLCTVERSVIVALAAARGQRTGDVTNGPTSVVRTCSRAGTVAP